MKIFNAISGSFFRTIGRMLAYAFIGFILFLCFSKIKLPKINDISDTINWSWFFGVQKVNAKETTVQNNYTYYMNGSAMTLVHDSFFSYSDNLRSNGSQNICFNSNCSSSPLNVQGMDEIRFSIGVENNNDSTIRCVFNGEMVDATALFGNLQNPYHQDDAYTLIFDNDYYKYTSLNCTNVKNGSSILVSASYDQGYLVNCNINNYFEGEGLETFFIVSCPVVKNQTTLNSINVQTGSYTIGLEIGSYITKIKSDGSQIIESQNQNAQNIINNQNQNNQSVINNQNQNTNATIENQNQNTQETINSQMVCNTIDNKKIIQDGFFYSNGNIGSSTTIGITDYIRIEQAKIKVLETFNSSMNMCYYNINKVLISCQNENGLTTENIVIPNNASFVRFSINKSQNKPQFGLCINGNQAMADTITDESGPSNISSLSNQNMVGWLPPGPVDSLINLPLVLLSSLQNALSSSCLPITLTLPFINQDIYLPCMSTLYEQMGVSSFVNWAGVVASAFILFSYLLRFYKWVDNTLTFRENNWLDNWGGE